MSTVIKAGERNLAVQSVAFNFDDMATKAKEYLAKIQAEAGQIIAKAKAEAVVIKKQAEVEGKRQGQAAIEQTVKTQLAAQLGTLLPALKQTITDIGHAKHAWLTHWEKSGIHVAAAIASRVIRRELAQAPDIPLALVREALELAAGNSQLRIHLNPEDHKALAPQIDMVVKEMAPLASAEVIADPKITRGGCRVETRFGAIDQQFEAQLARIEEELT